MNPFSKPDKTSLKIYFLIVSVAFIMLILVINFEILPTITKAMNEISSEETLDVENKFYASVIGFLIFLFLINASFWLIDGELTRQEREIRNNLNISPDDPILKYELKKIEKKRKLFFPVIELIFFIGGGIVIGLFIYYIVFPIYRLSLLGT